ncbi:MAG: HupE/UreJ family protein [Rhizobiales bacterium]|nr:HupE/UreJ family protein [Hyphomicrobiales bacterium]
MKRTALLAAFLSTLATPSLAHTGTGITVGFLHPLLGWDHLISMVAVGAWAAILGGRAIWAVPLAFVVAMFAGSVVAMSGPAMPLVEPVILTSVFVLTVLVVFRVKMPAASGMTLVGVFALAHGHAHGAEVPGIANAVTYVIGFMVATSLLHLFGVAATVLALRRRRMPAT